MTPDGMTPDGRAPGDATLDERASDQGIVRAVSETGSEPESPASDIEHSIVENGLVRFAIERRITMLMVILGVLVMGWLSLTRLPLEFLPAISSSNVSVSVSFPSSSPEEVAQRIIRPLEDSLGTLQNLDRLSAVASADSGRLDVSFVDGTDMDWAAVEVRDRVDRVRHLLPVDVDRIRIRRFQTSDIPVLRMHIAADWPQERLYDFSERVLQRRLERLDGVAQAQMRGLRTRQVQIRLDADRLASHGLDVREVSSTLRRNHLDASVGHMDEASRRLQVRVLGQLRSMDEIRRLPVATGLTLGDVAEVAYEYPPQDEYEFLNGVEALNVRIYKTSDANLLDVVERVKAEIAVLAADPKWQGHRVRIYHDSSEDVKKGLAQLRNAGFVGGALAIVAVFLFLRRVRTTFLVGVAIPMSVVFTFVLIFLIREAGWSTITLNVVSLMGLVLALGMLVDSSIVVIEAIYRRMERFDEDAPTAALRGASEVALPIIASTVTTLCVFVPVIFVSSSGGFFARYLVEVGTTICIVMVASLLVALTVVPMMAALVLAKEKPKAARFLHHLERGYGGTLRTTLRFRWLGLIAAGLMLWGSWHLFSGIERSFAGRTQERQVTINVDTPRNYSLQQTEALFNEIRGLLMAKKDELDIADVTSEYPTGSGRSRGGFRGGRRFELHLKDESESKLTTREVRDKVREMMPVKAGVELRIGQSRRRGGGGGGVELELSGDDIAVLELIAREVAAQMAQIPGIDDVDLSLESGEQEMMVRVDRARALQAGLSTQAVAQTVQTALSDRNVSYLSSDDREVDISMLFREEAEATLGQLRGVEVHGTGGSASLETLADFEAVPGPRSIERENRQAKIKITTNTDDPRAMGMAMRSVGGIMASVPLPPGYSWSFGRWNRMSQQDQEGSDFTLIFALILVYMLMASLFESFTHPFSIMMAVPFAFIGVGVVMKLAAQPRDNFTELGFIVLVGVVVNNAIVLVDHINRLRSDGMRRSHAILQGGKDRLRAILMTAVTTIVGLLPMVAPILLPQYFGPLEGRAATWAPVGLVILGGLTTSTFLTLLIVPTFYSVVDDIARFGRRVALRVF